MATEKTDVVTVGADAVAGLSASYQSSPPTQWNAGQTKNYNITITNTGNSLVS